MFYFQIILFLFFTNIVMASPSVDCSNPKNIDECAKITFTKTEASYLDFIKNVTTIFKEKISKKYGKDFLGIEKNWKDLVKIQCNHLRDFFQGGSIASSSFITCYDIMYENRILELKTIYDDILGER